MTLQMDPALETGHMTRFLTVISMSGWIFKTYGVALGRPRATLLAAAQRVTRQSLPSRPDLDGAFGVGFLTLHDTMDRCAARIHWWVRPDGLCQRAFLAPPDQPTALEPVISATIGYRPELEIIEHELHAWQRHVLARPGSPDLDGYLTDALG